MALSSRSVQTRRATRVRLICGCKGHREETSLVCPFCSFILFILHCMILPDGSVAEASRRSVCAEVANLFGTVLKNTSTLALRRMFHNAKCIN